MFAPDELIAALSDGGVEYVLIGGLAVGAHGFPRATKDVDVVPAPDAGTLDRLTKVLRAIEAQLGRLAVMQWVPGIPGDLAFEHLTRGAVVTSLGGRPVRVCSREDLIAMKRAAGRSQDLLDLEELGES